MSPSIQIQNLSYTPAELDKPLFKDITLQFGIDKIGLVGRNGVGKSSLLKLISSQVTPNTGKLTVQGNICFLAQNVSFAIDDSVAMLIGIQEKIDALQRITQGSIDEHDYAILGNDWLIENQANELLTRFGLAHLPLEQKVATLSGGERTRLHLVRVFISNADFILLDEPTNNLDLKSRQLLYEEINRFQGGVIIASHDRDLLRHMNKIVELTALGVSSYGGNFTTYSQQKAIEIKAAQQALDAEIGLLNKAKATIQNRIEKHQRNVAKGNRERKAQIKAKGRVDKIAMNSARGRSERSNRKIRMQADRKKQYVTNKLSQAKSKIEVINELTINMGATFVPDNKLLIDCCNVSYCYNGKQDIITNFNFKIIGPARIAICGDNGSGKTTLIKLIMGAIKPKQGIIDRKIEHIHYLDQHTSTLQKGLNVLDNFKQFNATLSDFECRSRLAQFLFRNKMTEKQANNLSGGEKLRALLACILMSAKPPQLLILDEPTNHLDLDSIAVIEKALQQYQGALLVISHDTDFLDAIGITQVIQTPLVA